MRVTCEIQDSALASALFTGLNPGRCVRWRSPPSPSLSLLAVQIELRPSFIYGTDNAGLISLYDLQAPAG